MWAGSSSQPKRWSETGSMGNKKKIWGGSTRATSGEEENRGWEEGEGEEWRNQTGEEDPGAEGENAEGVWGWDDPEKSTGGKESAGRKQQW